MRNHLHLLVKQRKSWKDANDLSGRYGWISNLGPWSVLSRLKPWLGVGESATA